jgi:putative spermidine/putrescine transport system ATP-binding protein
VTTDVELIQVRKEFAGFVAVEGCSLAIPRGEFISLLGPSGCGKTTTLNLIAGFLEPTRGRIWIRGVDVTDVPPNRRNLGMVFQNYALFPHMTVAQNVAFGLRMQGCEKGEAARRAAEALALVHMDAFAHRYPRQLSGGQQQRVALARAIAPRPSVLLLDEPLSNLDLKLREAMRRELKQLQRELGITALFVTHDQDEAMTMSDRVVVMHQGRIEQSGAPAEIYARPCNRFVAAFVGQMNFLDLQIEAVQGGEALARLPAGGSEIRLAAPPGLTAGRTIAAGVRPESIALGPLDGRPATLTGAVEDLVLAGAITQAYVRLDGGAALRVDLLSGTVPEAVRPGAQVGVAIAPEKVIVLQDSPSGP